MTRIAGIALLLVTAALHAQDVTVAVAANFQPTLSRLVAAFETEHGVRATIVPGATGQLYAQIERGAPFDIFLSADAERPALLREHGLAIDVRTYAIGQLVVWSADASLIQGQTLESVLRQPLRHVALANPRLAPYGVAAREALESLGLWRTLEPRIVYGQTVGQALAMAASRNAEIAIVARSLVQSDAAGGAFIALPSVLHGPIFQDAALLERARDNRTARALFEYLFDAPARTILTADGYLLPQ